MTTTTSKPFANANARSRHANLKAAFVALFVVAITAGFVAHAQSVPSAQAPRSALLATR